MRFTIGSATEIKYIFIALPSQIELSVVFCTMMLDFLVLAVEMSSSVMLHLEIPLERFLFQLKHTSTFR